MATYLAPEVLDNGIAYLQANCNQLAAVLAYTPGDSYATAMAAGNVVASAAMAPGDFTLSNGAGNARVLTSASKTATASGTGDPTHLLFVNAATSKILGVTQETSGIGVTAGVSYQLPGIALEMRQPVAV